MVVALSQVAWFWVCLPIVAHLWLRIGRIRDAQGGSSNQGSRRRHMTGMVLAWIVVGGIAGWLASVAVRGAGVGLVGDVALGIIGGIIGGTIVNAFGIQGVSGLNIGSVIIAFLGAVILLLLMRLLGVGTRRV
jgi:uncharacterized membrane protein YeaQ/YmgE (transglycosylase-associated protein family)